MRVEPCGGLRVAVFYGLRAAACPGFRDRVLLTERDVSDLAPARQLLILLLDQGNHSSQKLKFDLSQTRLEEIVDFDFGIVLEQLGQ